MTRRRTLLDRLWPRHSRPVQNGTHPAAAGAPPPTRPTRMVVSGRVVFGERIRSFDQARLAAGLDPRLRLWRDTAAVLVVFAVAIAVYDWLPRPQQAVLSETSAPTQLLGEPQTSEPSASEPSTEASASPGSSESESTSTDTPSPVSTPRLTPRPTPRATPGSTPQPTPLPSPSPEPPSPSPEPPSPSPEPAPPVAVIGTPACTTGDFSISFDGSGSTGTIDALAWDFGDQSPPSTEVSPTHVYASSGSYTVTLTVTGPGGANSATVDVMAPCP